MSKIALVDPTNQINRFGDSDSIDMNVRVKPGWRWLPVNVTMPTFDPATQVISAPVFTVLETQVTEVYTVRAKTTQEIRTERTVYLNGLDRVQFRILFNHENRVRQLESRPQVTQQQFIDFILDNWDTLIGANAIRSA